MTMYAEFVSSSPEEADDFYVYRTEKTDEERIAWYAGLFPDVIFMEYDDPDPEAPFFALMKDWGDSPTQVNRDLAEWEVATLAARYPDTIYFGSV